MCGDGRIVNGTRVVAAVGRLERVDAQEVRVRIDLNGFERAARRADHRPPVHCPPKGQRQVALGDGARQRQPLAQLQSARVRLLERRHLGGH